jgi:hypothetical protein
MVKRKKQKLGKNIQNMKNKDSIRVNPKNSKKPFKNKTTLGIESNYQRSKGYNTKSRKVKGGYLLFRSKNKVR